MLEKITKIFKISGERPDKKAFQEGLRSFLINLIFILFLSYFSSSLMVTLLLKKIAPSENKFEDFEISGSLDDMATDKVNYRDLQNSVLERNIFNNTGELPVEKDEEEKVEGDMANAQAELSLDGPCTKSSLSKLKLMGTMIFSNQDSFATVREDGINSADVYKIGDQIFGQENIKVIGIRANILILNNSGRKECLYSSDASEKNVLGSKTESSSDAVDDTDDDSEEESDSSSTDGDTPVVRLKSEWVQEQLGAGFTKIMKEVSTPPDVVDGEINGFKFYGISGGSLLGKIGLQDGDSIIEVNGRSTSESVFVFYQALSDETEILIGFQRGEERHSVKVIIE